MALLDGDRFEGRFRDGVHTADPSDLMRRMVKEELLRFDGTPPVPRAALLHRPVRALAPGGAPLQRGHRLRPRGDEPRRALRRRRRRPAPGQRRLRTHDPPAPTRLLSRGDLPLTRSAAASVWRAVSRAAHSSPRARPRSSDFSDSVLDDIDERHVRRRLRRGPPGRARGARSRSSSTTPPRRPPSRSWRRRSRRLKRAGGARPRRGPLRPGRQVEPAQHHPRRPADDRRERQPPQARRLQRVQGHARPTWAGGSATASDATKPSSRSTAPSPARSVAGSSTAS